MTPNSLPSRLQAFPDSSLALTALPPSLTPSGCTVTLLRPLGRSPMNERTLSIVKPDAVKKSAIGDILRRFESAGLRIVAAKLISLSKIEAQGFYAVHKER